MSDFLNKIFDDMTWDELICRLPGELAVAAINRKVSDFDKMKEFFEHQDRNAFNVTGIKDHINSMISNTSVTDILVAFPKEEHPVLFKWINEDNKKRIMDEGKKELSIEFVFNLTKSDDLDGMSELLDRILATDPPEIKKISSVIGKVDSKYFQLFVERLLKDKRAQVRACVLSTHNQGYDTISDHQKLVALKALAKLPSADQRLSYINPIDFPLFANMKPFERLTALDIYLGYFPEFKKIQVFKTKPTEEEFNSILFAGCFDHTTLVENIMKKYKAITEQELPAEAPVL